jgi:hypothetical protein
MGLEAGIQMLKQEDMSGTSDRKDRILSPKSGAWGSSSQDLVRLSLLLMSDSKLYASKYDNNFSVYALAGIPVLFSALRALLIEVNAGMYGISRKPDRLQELAQSRNEIEYICKYYVCEAALIESLKLAYEIRNEIAHPSHMPAGTIDGTPEYLSILRDRGLLQDGIWLSQLQSHRLFYWVAETIELVVNKILSNHYENEESKSNHLDTWSLFRSESL